MLDGGVSGLQTEVYAIWLPVDGSFSEEEYPADVEYTVSAAGDPIDPFEIDQNNEYLDDTELHDHDWDQLGGVFTFPASGQVSVQMEVPQGSSSLPTWGSADAVMLLPQWPKLDLATDLDNDGYPDYAEDEPLEDPSPGRMMGLQQEQDRAEVQFASHVVTPEFPRGAPQAE